jgi:hypothetical protein
VLYQIPLPEKKIPVGFYAPENLLKIIDQKRGPLSRSMYIVLVLQDALKRGIDAAKLVSGS